MITTYAAITFFVFVYIFGRVYPRQVITAIAIIALLTLIYPLMRNVEVTTSVTATECGCK